MLITRAIARDERFARPLKLPIWSQKVNSYQWAHLCNKTNSIRNPFKLNRAAALSEWSGRREK
jgi:hypothetical protein